MRKPYFILILIHFLLTTPQISIGLHNKTHEVNNTQAYQSEPNAANINEDSDDQHRERRSLEDEEEDKPFWANRGKRLTASQSIDDDSDGSKELIPIADENNLHHTEKNLRHEAPFWGNRGRRDSKETLEEIDLSDWPAKGRKKHISDYILKKIISNGQKKNACLDARLLPKNFILKYYSPEYLDNSNERREVFSDPTWGNRGRRGSAEISEEESEETPFWGNRGRRDNDPPFWGARGRRDEDTPFWGARGRRDDDAPFWGARGRRDDDTPFWGARGRRQDEGPFWGARGKKHDGTPFWVNHEKTFDDISDNLLDALKDIKSELNGMSRSKRSTTDFMPFRLKQTEHGNDERSLWKERGRNSGLQYLFSDKERSKARANRLTQSKLPSYKIPEFTGHRSIREDRLYAEQPYYIVVDRSSRSVSVNDDPYFISRGKKIVKTSELAKAARDRRGIIEQIAKNIHKDPYFVARGKKDGTEQDNILQKNPGMKMRFNELLRARELICSAIMLINSKKEYRNKREMSDRDRNRRAILKKLAAQLQNDPYFVSRGKKSLDLDLDESKLENFVKQVKEMCS